MAGRIDCSKIDDFEELRGCAVQQVRTISGTRGSHSAFALLWTLNYTTVVQGATATADAGILWTWLLIVMFLIGAAAAAVAGFWMGSRRGYEEGVHDGTCIGARFQAGLQREAEPRAVPQTPMPVAVGIPVSVGTQSQCTYRRGNNARFVPLSKAAHG